MKKILKFFIYFILLLFFVLLLLPKESLYNYLEHSLSKKKVLISNEQRNEKLLSLDINNAEIYYEGIKVANINSTSFILLLFYNEININNIKVLDSLSTIVPSSINNIKVKYSVLDYKNIDINSTGSFGEIEGKLNIITRKLIIKLKASSFMKSNYSKLLRNMRLKDGKYIWEQNL